MTTPGRDGRGRLLPGFSGNPSGRPKIVETIKKLASSRAPAAFARVVELMGHNDPRIALAASQEVLNRACGKPMQAVESKIEKFDWGAMFIAAHQQRNTDNAPRPATVEVEYVEVEPEPAEW